MKEENFKIENVIKIIPENDNYYYQIQPDTDELGLIELSEHFYATKEQDDDKKRSIVFTRKEARLIANKIIEYCDNDDNFTDFME